ncbi:glycosyl transferase [Lutimonas saemankumensis]|uniref:ATP-grasp fold amidoligase family protein n=1 Tax=Lutimonas saemankumensis TaxID=483016 RepID=UPI001CD3007F|nr:ATP-grasp fold amidoligase family protein [Lutimonas saemankumensis]MCA0931047.1 glycosyl transferase [Lutimonas saemankumensis]
MYKKRNGKYPNLKNPQLFTEKIQWLKLNDRSDFHTICADKYAVRKYISEEIGEKYLVPLLFSTKNVKDLHPKRLPDYPFIIKTNHDSQGNQIVMSKTKLDFPELRSRFEKKLKTRYYNVDKEWQYKNIKPRILIEKLLLDKNNNIPNDYKFLCFNGRVLLIQVDTERDQKDQLRFFYDKDWNKLDIDGEILNILTKKGHSSDSEVEEPFNLKKMIKYSEKIARNFDFVRVDWYEVDKILYFGEITFHPAGGFNGFVSAEWDKKYGNLLNLSEN